MAHSKILYVYPLYSQNASANGNQVPTTSNSLNQKQLIKLYETIYHKYKSRKIGNIQEQVIQRKIPLYSMSHGGI
jgi:TnpA family transposase